MTEPAKTRPDWKELLADRWWRLNHLYWIEDKEGRMVRFRPNWAQEELFHGLWFRNTILKVRQLGISTFCAVYMLDLCLFGKNQHCGIIDKTLEDGEAKLRKIAFAYEHLDYLPESPTMEDRALAVLGKMVKEGCAVVEKRATRMAWSTNGSVDVGFNLRGSTLQFLHISEFSYTALHDPARARKIRTGALNTVGKSCVVVMESTHEGGKAGLAYQLMEQAMEMVGKPLSSLDFRFFFFSWIQHREYCLEGVEPRLDDFLREYFSDLKKRYGIELSEGQKAWYATQYRINGAEVKQEFPTVPEEALQTSVEGAIYGRWISSLRAEGRIAAEFEADDVAPIYASWDLGLSDFMAIWLWQVVGGKYYALDYIAGNNQAVDYYVGQIRMREREFGPVALHLLPHDAARRDFSKTSFESVLQRAGFRTAIVPRTSDVWTGINALRNMLRFCVFHERCNRRPEIDGQKYVSGVGSLEYYRSLPPGANGCVREMPLHDACSHGADAARTFAEAVSRGLVSGHAGVPEKVKRPHRRPDALEGMLY